jgi:hypothetical protein
LLPILRSGLKVVLNSFQRRPLEAKGSKGGAKRRFGGHDDGQQQRTTTLDNPSFVSCQSGSAPRSIGMPTVPNPSSCKIGPLVPGQTILTEWRSCCGTLVNPILPLLRCFKLDSISSRDSCLLYQIYCTCLYVYGMDNRP